MSSSTPIKEFLKVIKNPADANLDIVFIHGLDPYNTLDHAEKTWTAENTTWPEKLLPAKLPLARILLFGYNANVAFSVSMEGIRGKTKVALFCSSAIVLKGCWKKDEAIRNATWGLVFFGTPHHGGNLVNLGKFVSAAVRSVTGSSKNTLLQNLERDGFMTDELSEDFREELEKYHILSFYETKVEKRSAVFGLAGDREETLGLNANHSDICKFANREAEKYELVEGLIVGLANDAVVAGQVAVKQAEQDHISVEQVQIFNITVNHITNVLSTQPTPPLKRFYDVPPRRVRKFIGREDVLADIHDGFFGVLRVSSGPRIVVIHGLGGQGKTQIALEYCWWSKNTIRGIFWVNSSSESTVEESFQLIADEIKTDGEIVPKNVTRFVHNKLNHWEGAWLLVFDNYDDVVNFQNIRNFMPDHDEGCILVTSRNSAALKLTQKGCALRLEGLAEDKALELLRYTAEDDAITTENVVAKQIVEKLSHHPLAITQAGSYISEQQLILDQFLGHYEEKKKQILKHTPLLPEYWKTLNNAEGDFNNPERETAMNVFTTWELSFEQLVASEKGIEKGDLLSLFAFFDNKDISEELFSTYCLLVTALEEYPSGDKYYELLNQMPAAMLINSYRERLYIADNILYKFLNECGRYIGAEQTILRAFATSNEQLCTENEISISIAGNLALTHQALGKFDLAEPLLRKVVERSRVLLGPKNLETLSFSASLGLVLAKVGKFKDAEKTIRETIHLQDFEVSYNHPDLLRSLIFLVTVLTLREKFAEAEVICQRVVTLNERVYGADHVHTFNSYGKLGDVYRGQGQLERAEEMHRRGWVGLRRLEGEEHPDTLTSMHNLALTIHEQGKLELGEEMLRSVIKMKKQSSGEEHLTTLSSVILLAVWMFEENRLEDATNLYHDAFPGLTVILGPNHPHIIAWGKMYQNAVTKFEGTEEAKRCLARMHISSPEQGEEKDHLEYASPEETEASKAKETTNTIPEPEMEVYRRNTAHYAICDGCNQHTAHITICSGCQTTIYGKRIKSLIRPDTDFCQACLILEHNTHGIYGSIVLMGTLVYPDLPLWRAM
ncbi:hypothetical protein IFR05_002549 [Cadophora sp. M221]|nr:hypothetical protein IFR05_002549 [Cadophora sp. M221]